MKKLTILFLALSLFFASCSGPAGPVGPQGPEGIPGQNGGNEYAKAIELITDFTPANKYSLVENYGFGVYPADVPLIYIRWKVDNGTEIWRQLPQSAYLSQGILSYNFDFTQTDFSIFLDGTVKDFSTVPSTYLNEQVFRIVVVPSKFLESGKLKSKSYSEIATTFGIKEVDIIKRDLR